MGEGLDWKPHNKNIQWNLALYKDLPNKDNSLSNTLYLLSQLHREVSLKSGHLFNQDTSCDPNGVHNREIHCIYWLACSSGDSIDLRLVVIHYNIRPVPHRDRGHCHNHYNTKTAFKLGSHFFALLMYKIRQLINFDACLCMSLATSKKIILCPSRPTISIIMHADYPGLAVSKLMILTNYNIITYHRCLNVLHCLQLCH